ISQCAFDSIAEKLSTLINNAVVKIFDIFFIINLNLCFCVHNNEPCIWFGNISIHLNKSARNISNKNCTFSIFCHDQHISQNTHNQFILGCAEKKYAKMLSLWGEIRRFI
ncbi:MAG: hypothetical protein ACQERB_12555, partial [Promethearchaeati archaeon]